MKHALALSGIVHRLNLAPPIRCTA